MDGAGCKLRSVQSLPTKPGDQIRYIGVRVEMNGSLQSVHKAIYAVETGKPYLFITGVVLKPSAPAGRPDTRLEPTIEAQLEIFGAVQSEAAKR